MPLPQPSPTFNARRHEPSIKDGVLTVVSEDED